MIYTSMKNRTPHDNEVWQCEDCGQIYKGKLVFNTGNIDSHYTKQCKKIITSENPFESAEKCCVNINQLL